MSDTRLRGAKEAYSAAAEAPKSADVHSGVAFDAWRTRVLSMEEFQQAGGIDESPNHAQLRYLATLASLAPTSHNTVPQRFGFDRRPAQLELWLDRRRVLPHSDAEGRQATISCGCVASFLAIGARAYGYQMIQHIEVERAENVRPLGVGDERYTLLSRISFAPAPRLARSQEWLGAMLARRSQRSEFDPCTPLDETVVSGMQQIVDAYPNLGIHVLTDPPTRMAIGKFQELADTTVFNRESFARELGDWLLPNESLRSVGMRGQEYGLSDAAALHFHRGLLGTERLLPDEIASLAKTSNWGMRSASAVVVLTADDDLPATRMLAGMALGELLLYLEIEGWVTALHAAITELDVPNLALKGRLRTSRRPVVVFRVGRIGASIGSRRPHSARPPLDDLMVPENPDRLSPQRRSY